LKAKQLLFQALAIVAIYAIAKAQELGAKVVTASDIKRLYLYAQGIDVAALKEIKEVKRLRVKEYLKYRPDAKYFENGCVWEVPCDVALPCATQNEIDVNSAKTLIKNGCIAVGEGANMPSTPEAIDAFIENKVLLHRARLQMPAALQPLHLK
jgi:glutamate dehydrogenase (NADP+)